MLIDRGIPDVSSKAIIAFVPGTFILPARHLRGQGDWRLVYYRRAGAGANLWLCHEKIVGYGWHHAASNIQRIRRSQGKSVGSSHALSYSSGFWRYFDSSRYFTRISFCPSAYSKIPQSTIDVPSLMRKITPVSMADIRHSITGSFEV